MAFALIFCVLRLVGLDHGRPPILSQADERHYAGVAARMSFDDLDPHRFENPPLLTYVLFAARELRALVSGPESTRRWVNQGGLYRLARILSALLGVATALLLAAAARRLGGAHAAWAALLLVGFSFLHGRDSHFGVNDVPMTFLVAVVTWISVRVLGGGGWRWALGGAVCAGLAAATKYNGAIAVMLPVLALLLAPSGRGDSPRRLGLPGREDLARREGSSPRGGAPWRTLAPVLVLPLVSLAAFLVANPFALLSWDEFSAGVANQYTRWGDNPAWGQSREPLALLYGQATVALLGPSHLAAALWGTVLVLARRRRLALLLLAFPVLYLAGMFTKELFFWRFVLPLLPALALLAALGWANILDALHRRRGVGGLSAAAALAEQDGAASTGAVVGAVARGGPDVVRVVRVRLPPLSLLVLLAASAWPAAQLVRLDQLLLRSPTWLLARDWILNQPTRSRRVFAAGLPPSLPLPWILHGLGAHLPRVALVKEPGNPLPAIEQGGLLITNSWTREGGRLERHATDREEFLAKVDRNFQQLAEFTPGPQGDAQPYVLDTLYAPLVDLWSIDRPGHLLKIYRVPPHSWTRRMGPGLRGR